MGTTELAAARNHSGGGSECKQQTCAGRSHRRGGVSVAAESASVQVECGKML
jgi:hypothetical protein